VLAPHINWLHPLKRWDICVHIDTDWHWKATFLNYVKQHVTHIFTSYIPLKSLHLYMCNYTSTGLTSDAFLTAVMLKPELEIPEPCAIPILATPTLATSILATPILPTPVTVVVKDYQMLVIALPVAMVTILLVVSVVSIGVFLCLRSRHKRWR